jgi:hypothetical protein
MEYEIFNIIISISVTTILSYVVIKREDMIKWMPAYVSYMIAMIIRAFSYSTAMNEDFMSKSFHLGAAIFVCLAVFIEYYQTFIKK